MHIRAAAIGNGSHDARNSYWKQLGAQFQPARVTRVAGPSLTSSYGPPPFRFTTVTWKVQVVVLPPESVAVLVTVVVPIGKQKPDDGEETIVVPGQLSLAVGAG